MRTIIRAITLSLVLSTLLVAQAALSGKWQGETRNGSQIVLDLTAKDTTQRTLTRNAEAFIGEIAKDEIKIWLDRQGPSSAIVLKRVKK